MNLQVCKAKIYTNERTDLYPLRLPLVFLQDVSSGMIARWDIWDEAQPN